MDEKKKIIIEHVGQMYLRYGIRSVTMDDVSKELGISKKTLYQYFKDKEELVDQVVVSCFIKSPIFNLGDKNGMNAIDRLMEIRGHVVKMLKLVHNNIEFDLRRQYPITHKKLTDFKRKRIYEDNYDMLEQGKSEELFRKEINSDVISRMATGRILLLFNPDYEFFTDEEVRDIDLFDQVMDYHIHAICTENGLKYYKQLLNSIQNEN